MGNQESSQTDSGLPPLATPKHQLVFRTLFSDAEDLMYGTSHIREILEKDGKSTVELDALEKELAAVRRTYLQNLLSGSKVAADTIVYGQDDYGKVTGPFNRHLDEIFRSMALNILISQDTFRELEGLVNELQEMLLANLGNRELFETCIRRFAEQIIDNDDYLANWGYFAMFLNIPDSQEYTGYWDPKVKGLEPYVRNVLISLSNEQLSVKSSYDHFLPVDQEPFLKMIPKGTFMVRGYKTYRGRLDKTRDFAWFGFSVRVSMPYLLPRSREELPGYKQPDMDHLNLYCSALGQLAVFQLNRDVKVLDFSNVMTIRYIRQFLLDHNAPPTVLKAFDRGWQESGTSFIRESSDVPDALFVNWMCSNGFNGYVATGVAGLHDEILLCNITQVVDYIGEYDPRKVMNLHLCSEPYSKYNLRIRYW